MPGMRPTIGGPGIQPSQPKGGGTMGVIMPIYTIGIIIFFLYTTMKIMFKNKYDEDYYNNYIKQYQAAQNMRPGSGPSGAEVEEVETCMEEVTEDTPSSVSVEEVEEEEE